MGRIQSHHLNILISLLVSFGILLFGYDQGVLGGIIQNDFFLKEFQYPSPWIVALVVALFEVGAFCGASVSGILADRLGRLKTISLGAAIVTVGGFMQAFSSSIEILLAGRILAGVGIGFLMSAIPLYQTEISPEHFRARLQSIQWITNIAGYASSYWLDFFMSKFKHNIAWRLPIAFQCFFSIILLMGVFFLPESPRWLAKKNKSEQCYKVLQMTLEHPTNHLRKNSNDTSNTYQNTPNKTDTNYKSPYDVAYENIMEEVNNVQNTNQITLRDMFDFTGINIGRRTLISLFIQAAQQFTGINAICYFQVKLYMLAGFTHEVALLVAGWNGKFDIL